VYNLAGYETTNGYPNGFWGWGGEDNAQFLRCVARRLTLERVAGRAVGYHVSLHIILYRQNTVQLVTASMMVQVTNLTPGSANPKHVQLMTASMVHVTNRVTPPGSGVATLAAGCGFDDLEGIDTAGLYKLKPVDPHLETTRFQPLSL
jgi:hypothetical protein